jgi:hypothetical protein
MTSQDSRLPPRRPRRSNTLKDLQPFLGAASLTHDDRKDRLATTASYLIGPVEAIQRLAMPRRPSDEA